MKLNKNIIKKSVKIKKNFYKYILIISLLFGFINIKSILLSLDKEIWIKIWKDERKLLLMKNKTILKSYRIALGFNPIDDKIKSGDGTTPIGRFYICEILKNPQPQEKYGARSLRISYPNIEDARRGLKDKLINKTQYLAIVKSINQRKIPPQDTQLGSSIRIHGGG